MAELGRALVAFSEALAEDVAGVLRPAAAQIQNTAGGVLHRAAHLNQANFKLAALRFAKLLSDYAWRPARQVQRLKVADIARKLRWRPMTWRAVIFTTLAVGMISAGAFAWALSEVPWKQIAEGTLKPVVVLETTDGKPLLTQGPLQGRYVNRGDFPDHLVDAVLTAEDRRFYDHFGVDPKGVARALYRNVGAGEIVEGGSTITQQLTKILYLERDRSWKRKVQEAAVAVWLDHKLGKDEVLTRYLNSVYLGSGATGVSAAARIYFDRDTRDLTLGQSAMLAALIRSPSQLSPLTNPDGARREAKRVLEAMVQAGKVTAPQAKAATDELKPTKPAGRSGSWFADWVMPEAHELAGPYRGTVTFRTTIVPRLQAIAEKVVSDALDREGVTAGASQAALVVMTPDGAVVAMVGGRDYGKSGFNRAVAAMRQPGSAFKLFVYYAALKAGFSPFETVNDEPINIGGWSPENYDGHYRGRVSIAEAFARSLNAATVALAIEVGIDKVIAAARELGVDTELPNIPSLALGTAQMSLLKLTAAYASVRAGTAPVEPWGIVSLQTDGQPRAFRVGPVKQASTDLRPYQRDLVGLLRLVVARGTGRQAEMGVFAAGKTGTSQNHRDAWFIGFTEPLVAGVWVGNDDEKPMNAVTGGELPARIWRNFMMAAMTTQSEAEQEPTNVSSTVTGETRSCNFAACARAYRSFRSSDCTYQPYRGSRKLCEK